MGDVGADVGGGSSNGLECCGVFGEEEMLRV